MRFTTDTVGAFYITVKAPGFSGVKFPCASVYTTMQVNEPHSAVVTINNGTSIGVGSNQTFDALGLLLAVQKTTAAATSQKSLIGCEIHEEGSELHSDQIIFRGYILSANLDYKADDKSSKLSVNLECGGPAVLLDIAPTAMYFDASLSNLLTKRSTKETITTEVVKAQGRCYSGFSAELFKSVRTSSNLPIAKILSRCIHAIKVANEYNSEKTAEDLEGFDEATTASIGGNTAFNPAFMNTNVCDEWIRTILLKLDENAASMSILQNLLATLTLADYCLQLVPRWSCETSYDFKLAVKPVDTWNTHNACSLSTDVITSIQVNHSAASAQQSPDFLFVSFDECLTYGGGENSERTTGYVGIAGNDAALLEILRSDAATDTSKAIQRLSNSSKPYRARDYKAPKWLGKYLETVEQRATFGTLDKKADPLLGVMPKGKCNESYQETDVEAMPNPLRGLEDVAQEIANRAADAIYNHIYRASDMCNVTLLPSIRFGFNASVGCLENKIGSTVTLSINPGSLSDDTKVSSFTLRGTLQSLIFQYSSEATSSISYKAILSRVRLVSGSNSDPALSCPFYTYNG